MIDPTVRNLNPKTVRRSTWFGSRFQMQKLSAVKYAVCEKLHKFHYDAARMLKGRAPESYVEIVPMLPHEYNFAFRQFLLIRATLDSDLQGCFSFKIEEKAEGGQHNRLTLSFEWQEWELHLMFTESYIVPTLN